MPPHRNGTITDTRYSKNQLLDLFRSQQEADGALRDGLPNLYVNGWEPNISNGAGPGGWSRNDQARDHAPGPDICWDRDGNVAPLGLVEMGDEEKEVGAQIMRWSGTQLTKISQLFISSVNSPLKPPTVQTNKEGQQREGMPHRKISISHGVGSPGGFNLASPNTTRPAGAKRRETSEAYPFPNTGPSAAGGRTGRDEQQSRTQSPPPALVRRRTDFKEGTPAKADESEDKTLEESADPSRTPFGTLKRNPTGPLSAGLNAPSSPWASTPQSTSFSPMGAFGNFALGNTGAGTPSDKRPGLGGGRAESRFKGLMSKDGGDDAGRGLREKASFTNLGRVHEGGDDDQPSGSAALGGGTDISPPRRRDPHGLGTPSRQDSRDDFGFAAFGMTSDTPANFRGMMQNQDQYGQTPQGRTGQQQSGQEPMSPTDTNPYQSPEQHGAEPEDIDTDGSDIHNAHLPGLGGFMHEGMPANAGGFAGLGNLGRVPAAPPSDRSQTSSVGPNRGFGGLSGLGALPGLGGPGLGGPSPWGAGQGTIGTPTRERAGLATNFGDNAFSGAEIQSPSLAGLGPSNIFGAPGGQNPGIGRGGRLQSLFPQAMQDQMRGAENRHHDDEASDAGDAFSKFGGLDLGRNTESPFRAGRGGEAGEQGRNLAGFGREGGQGSAMASPIQEPAGPHSAQPFAQPIGSSASNQPPAAQQKTMVMPDRMRWIYRDPQGVTQGPWSGLEMHDWYKAGFFSPELLVKKYEDQDYEPLAQLIRRIGNSREPFLVPQIGIPHGPPTAQAGNTWAGQGPLSSSGAQPPFASSFPSFGTTLTAEQQNALERRKQEEQYLMARQKEHLAQQQIAQRLTLGGPHPILPQQLHHHSSAHSLHSQPSFGSIASPNAFQPSPSQGPTAGAGHVPGFFDNSFRAGPVGGLGAVGAGVDLLGNIREEEMPNMLDRLNLNRPGQGSFGGIGQGFNQQQDPAHSQRVQAMLNDRTRLQQEQAQFDANQRFRQDEPGSNERLQQFQGLQGQGQFGAEGVIGKPIAPPSDQIQTQTQAEEDNEKEAELEDVQQSVEDAVQAQQQEQPSLTEQVQKAAAAKQTPPTTQSPWAKVDTSLPQPFPPAPSQSPLPAPAAQRNRSNVADALHAESRSRSQTPSVETPSASIAPWAKEPAEAPKGPSLKEIQDMEARAAAQAEEIAAKARRAALEKELAAQAQAEAPAPGLPSSATWATAGTASPAPQSPATAPSPWAKAAKTPTVSTTAKTLAQIQKEEEARKRRVAAAAAAAAAATTAQSPVSAASAAAQTAGKRYADLASKIASPAPVPTGPGGAWTTVGASGKVKTPIAPTPPAAARVVSQTTVPLAAAPVRKPTAPIRTSTLGGTGPGAVNAQEEFKKWAVNELRHDLNKGVSGKTRI